MNEHDIVVYKRFKNETIEPGRYWACHFEECRLSPDVCLASCEILRCTGTFSALVLGEERGPAIDAATGHVVSS